jgi:hypothetical protein
VIACVTGDVVSNLRNLSNLESQFDHIHETKRELSTPSQYMLRRADFSQETAVHRQKYRVDRHLVTCPAQREPWSSFTPSFQCGGTLAITSCRARDNG